MSSDRVGGSGIVRRHKATHATGGSDALTPADIGAAAVGDVVSNSLFTAPRQLLSSTASGTPAVIAIEDDQIILSNQVFN